MSQAAVSSHKATRPLVKGGALDLLRFLAAFFMVFHHAAFAAPVPLGEIHPVFERGYLATNFFLIVSGYVLGRIYGERVLNSGITYGAFFMKRATRVVPAHLIMIAAFVALVLVAGLFGLKPTNPEWFDWKQLPSQLLLVQALFVPGGKGWNAPSWSLSALLVCYALFPVFWRSTNKGVRGAAALALGVGTVAGMDLVTHALFDSPIYQMPLNMGVIRGVTMFLLGVCLARFSLTTDIRPLTAYLTMALAVFILIGVQFLGRHDFISTMSVAAIVVAAGAMPVKKPSKILQTLALVAFAIFITNEFVRVVYFGVAEVIGARFALSEATQWLIWWGDPVAAVAFAIGFHYLVDMPTQDWIRKRLPKPRPTAKFRHPVAA